MRRRLSLLMLATASLLVAACGDDGDGGGALPTHPDADSELGAADEETTGYIRDPAPEVGEHALPDLTDGGEQFAFTAPSDGLLLVFFGYTNCPDVCPNTMANLSRAMDELADGGIGDLDADDVEVAMVTIDPDRDLDLLVDYVQSFVTDGRALGTDDSAELRTVAEAFGASYLVEEGDDGNVDVGHTDALYGVDDTGSLVMTWPFGTTAAELVADIDYLSSQTA